MDGNERKYRGELPEHVVRLPCGARGWRDGCGYRCYDCMAIYGSVSCPCTKPEISKLPRGDE
jgi:hypothetical protein